MYAFINLFIYILKHPGHPRILSDLALLDIGAGHFAGLEFATDSEISVPFVREVATLARDAIKYARSDPSRYQHKSAINLHDEFARPLSAEETADSSVGHMRMNDYQLSNDKDVSSPFPDL
jgi:hypothetical protein